MDNALERFLRWGIVAVVLGALTYGGLIAGKSYNGYCFEQERYLSDQEKIDILIKEVLMTYPPILKERDEIGGFTHRIRPRTAIPYKDIDEFKRINPNCCRLTFESESGYRIPFSDRLFGRTSTLIHIKYLVRYKRGGKVVETPIEYSPPISNCGRIWSGF